MEKNRGETAGSWTFILVFLIVVASAIVAFYFYNKWTKKETEAEKKAREEKEAIAKAEADKKKVIELEKKNEGLKNEMVEVASTLVKTPDIVPKDWEEEDFKMPDFKALTEAEALANLGT